MEIKGTLLRRMMSTPFDSGKAIAAMDCCEYALDAITDVQRKAVSVYDVLAQLPELISKTIQRHSWQQAADMVKRPYEPAYWSR